MYGRFLEDKCNFINYSTLAVRSILLQALSITDTYILADEHCRAAARAGRGARERPLLQESVNFRLYGISLRDKKTDDDIVSTTNFPGGDPP